MNYTEAYKKLRSLNFGRDESLKALDDAELAPSRIDDITVTLTKDGFSFTPAEES